jgi:hypothetical protein
MILSLQPIMSQNSTSMSRIPSSSNISFENANFVLALILKRTRKEM